MRCQHSAAAFRETMLPTPGGRVMTSVRAASERPAWLDCRPGHRIYFRLGAAWPRGASLAASERDLAAS